MGHLDDLADCDEGYWRKRLLAFIQSMFVLLLILVGLNFFTGLTSGHFSLVPFFPLMFLWLVLYVGHIGAHKRRASFLHAYFILNVLRPRHVHLVPGCPGYHPVRARWRLRRRLLVG